MIPWAIALTEVALLSQATAFWLSSNRWFASEFAIPGSMALALVGALIASRLPSNRFGWLLLFMPVPGLIAFLCTEYTDLIDFSHWPLPLEPVVMWVSNWAWTPSFGIGIAMLTVRFPDGRVPPGWRIVDVLAVTGTVILAAAIAWATFPGTSMQITALQTAAVVVGLAIITMGAVAGVWSLFWRYRHGDADLRLQIKWMLLASILLTIALVFAAVLEATFSAHLDFALAPFYAAMMFVPVAIGVAILRYRLFDIDVIISRTLVYVIVTAFLGGLYIGVIELMQQVSILYTGQRSETAVVLTAFVVAGAFTPVQKWADNVVERRFQRGDAAARLHSVSAGAESMVRVIDPHGFAHWLIDESVAAFEADGGAVYLDDFHPSNPFHTRGRIGDGSALEIPIQHQDHEFGRLVLGRRRGGMDYSHRDVDALKRSGLALGAALALATDLGHFPAQEPQIKSAASNGAGAAAPGVRAPGGT